MSSLMQHDGVCSKDGVRLLCYLVEKGNDWEKYNGPNSYNPSPEGTAFTNYKELIPGTKEPVLYAFYRKPVKMWGCWVVFRYFGKEHAPDLSVPIALFRLPRGAVRLNDEAAKEYWRS